MPNPAALAATAGRLTGDEPHPIRVCDLHHVGVTPGQVRAAIAGGHVMTLRRGVVFGADAWRSGTVEDRRRWALQAALLSYPGAFASHETAAWLLRLPDYRSEPLNGRIPATHITRLGAARRDDWLRIHGTDTPPEQVSLIDGMASSDVVRTSIELAARRSLGTALVFLDAGMRAAARAEFGELRLREALQRDDVRRGLAERWRRGVLPYARHRWVTRVRAALAWADPAAESVLESLSRVAIREAGLPAPRCGVPVHGDDGRLYWVDLLWDGAGVIGEADGLGKYASIDDLVREKRRHEALAARGYRIVRWGWSEVMPDASVMVARIRRALSEPPSTRLIAS